MTFKRDAFPFYTVYTLDDLPPVRKFIVYLQTDTSAYLLKGSYIQHLLLLYLANYLRKSTTHFAVLNVTGLKAIPQNEVGRFQMAVLLLVLLPSALGTR